MTHELLEREDIAKKTIYNPREPIATVLYAVKELLELDDITGTSYTQLYAVSINYVILHRMGKFGPEIREWNRMLEIKKTWVQFKQNLQTSHGELRETSNITVEDAGIHHANMVRNIVAEIQEALQQEYTQTETLASVQAPVDHVANTVKSTHQQ